MLLVIAGVLRMNSRYRTTEPDEPAAGVPTMRRVVPDSLLPTDDVLAAWLAMPAVLPPHEMPPVIPGPDRTEA
ncbi:MAG TPA: hypothetical protein VFT95_03205 [Micromonosporaceae bacterium]|nr:hypothetical protein [Micromonosporaceae bacterium]